MSAVVAAHDEADRIGDAVRALLGTGLVGEVAVADDGSSDGTGDLARAAGAMVVRSARRRGKGAAVEAALSSGRIGGDVVLLVDGDVGPDAAAAVALLEPVLAGNADLAVGILPRPPTGGFGLVKRFAAGAVERVSGRRPVEPLSGQRALTRACLEACRPLAARFGLETAMLADAARLGFPIAEIPVQMGHRFTRRDLGGFLHRGRQGADIVRALAPRLAGLR